MTAPLLAAWLAVALLPTVDVFRFRRLAGQALPIPIKGRGRP